MIDLTPGNYRYRHTCTSCEVGWSDTTVHSECWVCGHRTQFRTVLGDYPGARHFIHYKDFYEETHP